MSVRARTVRFARLMLPATAMLVALSCATVSRDRSEEFFREGFALEQQKKPWDAIGLYRRSVAADPSNLEPRLRLADLLYDTGDIRAAEVNYKTVLKQDPANVQATNNLAWLYAQDVKGFHLDWAEEAMKPIAEKESPHRHLYLDTLGLVQFRRGKFKESAETLGLALELCRGGKVLSTSDECRDIDAHWTAARLRR